MDTVSWSLECKRQGQVKATKGSIQRERTRAIRREISLQVQQGHVQTQGLQIRTYLQQVLQDFSQRVELQGEQPRHHGHQLTKPGRWKWSSFTEFRWCRNWNQSVPHFIHFFREQRKGICLFMGQKVGLAHGHHSSSRND